MQENILLAFWSLNWSSVMYSMLSENTSWPKERKKRQMYQRRLLMRLKKKCSLGIVKPMLKWPATFSLTSLICRVTVRLCHLSWSFSWSLCIQAHICSWALVKYGVSDYVAARRGGSHAQGCHGYLPIRPHSLKATVAKFISLLAIKITNLATWVPSMIYNSSEKFLTHLWKLGGKMHFTKKT